MASKRGAATEMDDDQTEFETSKGVKVIRSFDQMGLKEDLVRGIYAYGIRNKLVAHVSLELDSKLRYNCSVLLNRYANKCQIVHIKYNMEEDQLNATTIEDTLSNNGRRQNIATETNLIEGATAITMPKLR
ncbi:uncharacterized protein TRIADDRAFT_61252 [Trichoplax adhaerens]|uniref:Uncharacterized protein n=1 Tax=Trichoplax adhaerens TaxID=10228 RepID=B3SAG6_TRIAD|nr:hypothetical protein TRIADDRAFT_61252 [Trichoplax adhaerens]EDV20256.1 hypothetical protein TRIADDRAFT_61252 [Trichoplax adhaerens]|eukprot:XP_002117206.1 hypothetical protein TRIADDRAFT_61252 [Trichoplax adhaerens]